MKSTNYLRKFLQWATLQLYILTLKTRQHNVVLCDKECENELGTFRVQITLTPEPYILRVRLFGANHLTQTFIVNNKIVDYKKRRGAFYLNCTSVVKPTETEMELYIAEVNFVIPNPYHFNFHDHTLLLNGSAGDEIRIKTGSPQQPIPQPYLLPAHFVVQSGKETIPAYAVRIGNTVQVFWDEGKTGKTFTLNICKTPISTTRG